MRQKRKDDLEKHVNEVNTLLRKANGDPSSPSHTSDSEKEFEGFDEPVVEPIDEQEEYIDEDKYTTVTIESVGISKDGFEKAVNGDEDGEESKNKGSEKRVWKKEKPKTNRPKKRKIKFRYESKAERKVTRMKQGARNRREAQARKSQ